MTDTSPIKRKPLTHSRQADTAKPEEKPYTLNAGDGLFLEVLPTGAKRWRYRYTFEGKRGLLSMGVYPRVSMADAKAARDQAIQYLNQGVDPSQAKKQAKRVESKENLFETIARRWLADRVGTITDQSHKRDLITAENDVFPCIGHLPINQIKAPDMLAMARKVEARGAGYMARRALSLSGRVFRHAMREGLTDYDPTTGIGEALKPHVVQHMKRISQHELPEFLQRMDSYQGDPQTCLGLKLMNLCFVRTKELRFMEWKDIDFDNALWRISAEKMKKRRPHIVPLSRQAIQVLHELQQLTGNQPFAFFNFSTRKPYSEAFFNSALNRMGYKGQMTGHGFRGLASTILHEQQYHHAAIELQLAHVDKDSVSASYNHADHLPYRAKMMQEWADYLDSVRMGQIVAFPKAIA